LNLLQFGKKDRHYIYREEKIMDSDWEVIVWDPVVKKNVHLIITAPDSARASQKALEMTVPSPWTPAHRFKVEKIIAVSPYPWKPSTTISVGAVRPYYVKKPREETLYMVNKRRQQIQLKRSRWWEKGW